MKKGPANSTYAVRASASDRRCSCGGPLLLAGSGIITETFVRMSLRCAKCKAWDVYETSRRDLEPTNDSYTLLSA